MGLKILQLSDLHLGRHNDYANAETIAHEVRRKEIDCILFLGDLIDGSCIGQADYISNAVTFFDTLIQKLNEYNSKNHLTKTDVYFIPGNHEIDRAHYTEGAKMWGRYQKFLTAFYFPFAIPSVYDQTHWSFLKQFEAEKVILLGFNSANHGIVDPDEHSGPRDYGEISPPQMYAQIHKLESIRNLSQYSLVACLHHHFI